MLHGVEHDRLYLALDGQHGLQAQQFAVAAFHKAGEPGLNTRPGERVIDRA